ncbi:tetraspanin-7 [Aedes albopictus]|uniref:Tetraspanin n=1 Tax=Aedes albopictus TaxID=7160 RepID=A0A023EMK4_AEDAL|nr:tetraspanin-7-like [Aedes albopictus]XP_029714988.1 tetraspanin-7-like [Aedes albopictus]XP_029714989.1 tetraspanin-7-like [Aedes albopictus]
MTTDRNDLNMGMRCVKYMIFVINFMFLLTAILIVTVGTAIGTIFGDFEYFIDSHFFSPAHLLVAIGIIMMFVSIFGCIGAVKESTAMINIYGVLLAIVFILELAAAISAFALQGQVKEMVRRTLNESMANYNGNPSVEQSVDFMQQVLECCGVDSHKDWSFFLQPVANATESDVVVPESCCPPSTLKESCIPYEYGCLDRLQWVVAQSAALIATGAMTVAFVQILGSICAFMLARTIRRTKSLRAARRWQLQQSLGIMTKPHNPSYTQMEKSEKNPDSEMYLPNSPSVN